MSITTNDRVCLSARPTIEGTVNKTEQNRVNVTWDQHQPAPPQNGWIAKYLVFKIDIPETAPAVAPVDSLQAAVDSGQVEIVEVEVPGAPSPQFRVGDRVYHVFQNKAGVILSLVDEDRWSVSVEGGGVDTWATSNIIHAAKSEPAAELTTELVNGDRDVVARALAQADKRQRSGNAKVDDAVYCLEHCTVHVGATPDGCGPNDHRKLVARAKAGDPDCSWGTC